MARQQETELPQRLIVLKRHRAALFHWRHAATSAELAATHAIDSASAGSITIAADRQRRQEAPVQRGHRTRGRWDQRSRAPE